MSNNPFNLKGTYTARAGANIQSKIKEVLAGGLSGENGSLVLGNAGNDATGASNLVVGIDAGLGLSYGASNTLLGDSSGQSLTIANFCTYLGAQAGNDATTGNHNVGVGYLSCGAGNVVLTGVQNVCVGSAAGENLQAGAANNTFIGFNSGNAATAVTGAIGIGSGVVISASRELALGSVTAPLRTTGGTGPDAAISGFLRVTVNGLPRMIQLYTEPA